MNVMYLDTLDRLHRDFAGQERAAGAEFLCSLLAYLRRTSSEWQAMASRLREHPLFDHLLHDPCTSRGLACRHRQGGHAELIQLLCDYQPAVPANDEVRDFFSRAMAATLGEAFRQRQTLGQTMLAEAVAERRSVCVLACGYLGEADALAGQSLGHFAAVDADFQTLARIRRTHGETIELHCSDPGDWLRQAVADGRRFDFIYAPALSDRMDNAALLQATCLATQMLSPGGRLLIGALRDNPLSAYLEAAMDWHLVYRDAEDLACVAEHAGLTYRLFGDRNVIAHFCEAWFPNAAA